MPNSNTRGGHPPAVKAGNMRITRRKPSHDKNDKGEPITNVIANDETNILKMSTGNPQPHVAGATVHGHSDFTPEAVQAYHDKPQPTHEHNNQPKKPVIHQPRK